MSANFNTYIEYIEPEFWRKLCIEDGVLRHYDKGEDFVTAGSVGRYIGYIKSGTMKYVAYSSDGSEHVVGFELEGEFVADFPFSLFKRPSRISIVAISPCDIYCISTQVLAERMIKDSVFSKIVFKSTAALFDTTYNRYIELYTQSTKQRYDNLILRYPNLFERFPLKDIASFLNVTPTHLSRLRKGLDS